MGEGYYAVAHHSIVLSCSSNHQCHVPTPNLGVLGPKYSTVQCSLID